MNTFHWELRDRMFSEENMYNFVMRAASDRKFDQTLRALPAMRKFHEGQTRKGKEHVPYIYHPLTAACHALALGIEEDDILAAVLLHDVCEDCGVEPEELLVNQKIQKTVAQVTFRILPGESREQAKERYFWNISKNRDAIIVKILDRCHNISTMATGFPVERMAAYIDETEKYVLPLLNLLKVTYPEFYNAAFLLKYQMMSVLESLKRTIITEV